MKILVINNITDFLPQIKRALGNHEIIIYEYNSLDLSPDNFDAIILTGGHSTCIENHSELYEKEIGIILRAGVPIFGICLGFEIICHAFGENLTKLETKEHGINYLSKKYQDSIFDNLPETFEVFESHRWCLKETKNLIPLASSRDGIEVVKHPERLIYGVQFHPERFINKIQGYQILSNFIEMTKNNYQVPSINYQ